MLATNQLQVHFGLVPELPEKPFTSLQLFAQHVSLRRCVNNPLALISHQLGLNMHILRPRCDLYDGGDGDKESKKRRIRKSANSPVSAECDKRMDFHFNALLDIITEWRQAQEQDAVDCSLGGETIITCGSCKENL